MTLAGSASPVVWLIAAKKLPIGTPCRAPVAVGGRRENESMSPAGPPPRSPGAPVRMFYVDDSGSTDSGFVVYAWVECRADEWRLALRSWLDLRAELFVKHAIPPAYELHTSAFAGGRGRPSANPQWNLHKRNRSEALEVALARLGATPSLSIGAVFRITSARGSAFGAERGEVYRRLVAHLDSRLEAAGELGMILMDGDGSETSYYGAHRALKLAHRSVIEDPLFQASHRSQWIQMADLVAWSTYQALRRNPANRYAWDWYDRFLRGCDVNGGPLVL